MAFTFGKDNTTDSGGSSRTSASSHVLLSNAAFTRVGEAGDYVDGLGYHAGSNVGDGAGIEIGLYDITAGIAGATLLRSAIITTPTPSARNVISVDPLVLTVGNTYCTGFRVASTTNLSIFSGYFGSNASRFGSLSGTSALTNWADGGVDEGQFSVFAVGDSGDPDELSVTVSNPVGDNTGIIYQVVSGSVTNGDIISWNRVQAGGILTIRANTTFFLTAETFPETATLEFVYYSLDDDVSYNMAAHVRFSEDGEGTVTGIAARNITLRGITLRNITSRGYELFASGAI